MAPFKDHTVTIEFTVTHTYAYAESADIVAKAMGISLAALRRIVEDGEDLEAARLAKLVDVADLEDTEYDVRNYTVEEWD